MQEEIKLFKQYLTKQDGSYDLIKVNKRFIKNHYPLIYQYCLDNFKTKIYCLLYDIQYENRPVCLNCHKHLEVYKLKNGFKKYCSGECAATFNKEHKISSNTLREKYKTKYKEKYPDLDISSDPNNSNYLILTNYCKHGDLRIYRGLFNKLYKLNRCLCLDCNKETFNNYNPTEEEINSFHDSFNEFYQKNKFKFSEYWWLMNYPKEYKIIHVKTNFLDKDSSDIERVYCFKNKIIEYPKCFCGDNCYFLRHSMNYTTVCFKHRNNNYTSKGENEVKEFLSSLNVSFIERDRSLKKEIDIYIPSLKLGIEFNGLWWHGEENKEKNYHVDKMNYFNKHGIQLINIWEDDWNNKKDIVKSIIKNKLKLNNRKIYARKCQVKLIDYNIKNEFINQNHIQGDCVSTINLGLYFNDELVSVMTFGKNRFKNDDTIELLRFCNKLDTSVIGGASKLFKFFIKTYKPTKVISYANRDISVGKLYEILGFEKIRYTPISYWWVNNSTRYNRTLFQKHLLVKEGFDSNLTENEIMHQRGFYKIYGTGNILFEFNNK